MEGFFDYKLRPDASHERNDIRLLERLGLPPQIVQEALALAERQASREPKPRTH